MTPLTSHSDAVHSSGKRTFDVSSCALAFYEKIKDKMASSNMNQGDCSCIVDVLKRFDGAMWSCGCCCGVLVVWY